jgi:O-6-methylguanine DNA methyltransferase
MPLTVALHAKEIAGRWFAVACAGESLVATTVSSSRGAAIAGLRRSLPPGARHEIAGEPRSEYVERMLGLLAELEAGDETHKAFSLAPEVAAPLAGVLKVAAAVPLGYVTSYGEIAKAAGTEPKEVGGIMASNPLYPIVACHRVVGADLSLTGYRGSRGAEALQAKLARLSAEARGFTTERQVSVDGRSLRVYPVEWAIAKAAKRDAGRGRQGTLFE